MLPLPGVALLLAAALSVAAPPEGAAADGVTRRTIPGDRVSIHNLVGNLTVVRGDGPSIVAEVRLNGRDADGLRIADGFLRGVHTLRVVYPWDRIHVDQLGGRSTFWVRDDGTLNGKVREGRKVELSGRRGGREASADMKVFLPRGKLVHVHWGHGIADVRDVDGTVSVEGSSMEITASGVRGSLRLSVGSGSVRVSRGRGRVHVETGSGDVELHDTDGEELSIETGSGNIRVSGLESPDLSLETGSGDIQAESVRAVRAALETGSGNVDLLLNGLNGDASVVSVETGSGNVDVSVPRGFGGSVHMETGSGSIETSVPMEIRKRDKNELSGTIGDGRGKVSLETGSGTIALRSGGR